MNNPKAGNLKNHLAVMSITILIYMTYILLSILAIMLLTGTIHIISGKGTSHISLIISKGMAAVMAVVSVVYFIRIWKRIFHYAEDLVYRRNTSR